APVVVVARDATPGDVVRVKEVGRGRERVREALREVAPDRLLVVARVEQRPVVVLRETREEILRLASRSAHTEVGLVRGLGITEHRTLIVLRPGVHAGD